MKLDLTAVENESIQRIADHIRNHLEYYQNSQEVLVESHPIYLENEDFHEQDEYNHYAIENLGLETVDIIEHELLNWENKREMYREQLYLTGTFTKDEFGGIHFEGEVLYSLANFSESGTRFEKTFF